MIFNQPYTSFSPLKTTASMLPLKAKFNWGSLLTNTQKTLGVINQAIPIFYQFGPIVRNAKTMFKVMGEFSKINNSSKDTSNKEEKEPVKENKTNNSPNFFA
jgi:hypothetical protein